MAFAILWISRTRCLRISAAAKFWEVAAGTKRCREVHRTAGEHCVHDSDRPGVRYDLRRQGTLSVAPAYLLTVPLLGSLSSLLSRRVKPVQKLILPKPTPLPAAPTKPFQH